MGAKETSQWTFPMRVAHDIEQAVAAVLAEGKVRTPDLGGVERHAATRRSASGGDEREHDVDVVAAHDALVLRPHDPPSVDDEHPRHRHRPPR